MDCKINFVPYLVLFLFIGASLILSADAAKIASVVGCTPESKCKYSDASKWVGGVVPGEADDVVIDANGVANYAFYIDTDRKMASLTIVGGAVGVEGSLTVGNVLTCTQTLLTVHGGILSAPQWSIDGGEIYLNNTAVNIDTINTKNSVIINAATIGTQLSFAAAKLDMMGVASILVLTGYNVALAQASANAVTLNSCDGYIGSPDIATAITTITIASDSTIMLSNINGNKIISPKDGAAKQIFFANKVYFANADLNQANVQVMSGGMFSADNSATWAGSSSIMVVAGSANVTQQVGWFVMDVEMDDPTAEFTLVSSVLKGGLTANAGTLNIYDASITGNVTLGGVDLVYPVTDKIITIAQNLVTSTHTTLNFTSTMFKSKPHIIVIQQCVLAGKLFVSFDENAYKLISDQEYSYIDLIESQLPIENSLEATIHRPSSIKSASLVTRSYNKLNFLSVRVTNPDYVKSRNVGTLFGIIFGSIMGVALIVGITIFIIKKRKSLSNSSKVGDEEEKKQDHNSYSS
ncbi:hypothetical protein CYY_009412 [Polysphondylium violaceum]|uniref:Uncharacterized protein n=1 Tax=Polysphondylium violaceum TaxID=133409 RepID=A0A8J4UW57_9MYCE|nr:hypothetical protein CYY_009412 [Polysphondylium violaceum]